MGIVKNRLYVLHGWTYSLDKWDNLIKALAAQDIEVTVLRVPGLGVESKEVWNLPKYVAWLNEKLAGQNDVNLLGHSNGGRIALAYAVRAPDRVKKLFLLDSAGIYHDDWMIRFKRNFGRVAAKAGKRITRSDSARKIFYRLLGAKDYYQASPNMRATMQNMLEADKILPVSRIKVPTTIIWGSSDKVTPLSDGRKLHQRIKSSQLNIIKGGRHSPQFTHTKQVAEIIINELAHSQ